MGFRCYWYQRYLILKAIHNTLRAVQRRIRVVTDIKDTSFWKQFTTTSRYAYRVCALLLISKIPHFESNSQLQITSVDPLERCYWYQRYLILKAIHNEWQSMGWNWNVVTDIKDTSFWKQFTTEALPAMFTRPLLLISKIPHFESNSQQEMDGVELYFCCYWYQRYLILKAIHNKGVEGLTPEQLLLISKIPHFESNSQL